MSEAAPQWVQEYAADCRKLLGIEDGWRIKINMVDAPGGEAGTGGWVDINYRYMNAVIEIANSTENNEDGRHIVLHEMMHIALSPLSDALDHAIESLSAQSQRIINHLYINTEEQVIQRITRALLRNIAQNPEGHV